VGLAEDEKVNALEIRISAHGFPDESKRFLLSTYLCPDTPAMRENEGGWIERECLFSMGNRLVISSFDDGAVGQLEINGGLG
ncbi:uncharacterized protein METZ01_LOCUS508410, partial [marine metagenome]